MNRNESPGTAVAFYVLLLFFPLNKLIAVHNVPDMRSNGECEARRVPGLLEIRATIFRYLMVKLFEVWTDSCVHPQKISDVQGRKVSFWVWM